MRKLLLLAGIIYFILVGSVLSAQTEDAIRKLQGEYNKNKKDYYTNIRLAYLYNIIKKYANAEFHNKNALKIKKKSIEPLLGLYYVNMALKQYKKAEEACKKIIRIDKNNYYGNLYYVYSLMWQKNYANALKTVLKMRQLYPADLNYLWALKNIYTALKQPEDAKRVGKLISLLTADSSAPSDQAIRNLLVQREKDMKNYYINIRLGYLYYIAGKYKEAITYYGKAAELDRKSVEAYLGLKGAYYAMKRYSQAAKACREVLKRDPNNYYGNLYLIYSLAWMRDYTSAKKYAVRMIKIYPSDLSFLTMLRDLNKYMQKTNDQNRIQKYIDQLGGGSHK